jgi:hypothetical protein
MARTELSRLALPAWAVPSAPRDEAVAAQSIAIRPAWWRAGIGARGLPGEPPAEESLTRAAVWCHADDVFTLLWHALSWGAGRYLRQNVKRLNAIRTDVDGARALLTTAAELSRTSPQAAYEVLRPGHRNAIGHLGPSFFTKFLYFAGGGDPAHPSLILDRRVATSLRDECGWESLHRMGPWPPDTYARYCDLLHRWAKDHDRAADELERTLFSGPRRDGPSG